MPELTPREKREFHRNGFLVRPGAVDPDLVGRAREAVWAAIEEEPGDDTTSDANRSVFTEDVDDPEPFRELNDLTAACCEALVGDHLTYDGDPGLQLPLRFPREERVDDPASPQISGLSSHVDGYLDVEDGEGDVVPHTIMTTVYLDRVQPCGGGFSAWPGSHRDVCRFFEDHPVQAGKGGIPAPDGEGGWREDASRDEVFDPVEVVGPPGTLTIWHGRLEHAGGINLSPGSPRMAAIKRFFHEDGERFQAEAPGEPYRGWDGMDEVV